MRTRVLLLAATTLLLGQACGQTSGAGAPSQPPSGAHSLVSSPALQVEVRLELPSTTIAAGSALHGVLIVDNYGPGPLKTACGFTFAAGLANADISFRPAFTLECRSNQSLPSGVTRYPVTLITTYSSCSQSGSPDGSTPGCLPGPIGAGSRFTVAPPLPRGTYRT